MRGLNKPCAREQTMHCRLDGVGDTYTILCVGLHTCTCRVVHFIHNGYESMRSYHSTISGYLHTVRTMAARG